MAGLSGSTNELVMSLDSHGGLGSAGSSISRPPSTPITSQGGDGGKFGSGVSIPISDHTLASGVDAVRNLLGVDEVRQAASSYTRTPRMVLFAKTRWLVGEIARTFVLFGGFGGEIVAQLQEEAFDYLDAPIARVGAPFSPVPYSPALEKVYIPNADNIVAEVKKVLGL